MVALSQHRGDLGGHGAIIGVMHGGGGIPLSAVRPCGMGVIHRKALDMYGSPHLTILYLLRDEQVTSLRISPEFGLVTQEVEG